MNNSYFGYLALAIVAGVSGGDADILLHGNHRIVAAGTESGELEIQGDLNLWKGLDLGSTGGSSPVSAFRIHYSPGAERTVRFDLTETNSSFLWRDNLAGSPKNRMRLDPAGNLVLFNESGGEGLVLGGSGRIELDRSPGSGIFSGGARVLGFDQDGRVEMGAGDLVVRDSFASLRDGKFNELTIGRGNNNESTNTALGMGALAYSTFHGIENTAVGYAALNQNTSGRGNTATGHLALRTNNTGGNNSAFGSNALSANTTGSNNIAIGVNSMWFARTGSANTAVGSASMVYNLAGSNNTALGARAGAMLSSGNGNVMIGYNAGMVRVDGTALTGQENGVFIGGETRGAANGDRNAIVIGYQAVSLGSNTTVIGNSATVKARIFGELEAPVVQSSRLIASSPAGAPALVVNGESRLQGNTVISGKVIIEQVHGDISMGIYGE